MRHHAIVVTSWNTPLIEEAHAIAGKIFPWVSEISPEMTNGYRSFFIPPDRGESGWDRAEAADEERADFIRWCDSKAYKDGSSSLRYVEVFFGDDGGESAVERFN